MLISLFFVISLLTFDINDNSFLTNSSGQTNNIFDLLAPTFQVLYYIPLGYSVME